MKNSVLVTSIKNTSLRLDLTEPSAIFQQWVSALTGFSNRLGKSGGGQLWAMVRLVCLPLRESLPNVIAVSRQLGNWKIPL